MKPMMTNPQPARDIGGASVASQTHEVRNQPTPLTEYNAFTQDEFIKNAVRAFSIDWVCDSATNLGARVGSEQVQEWARLANENKPVLKTHDRFGYRIDAVEFHPAYHELMSLGIGAAMHSLAWTARKPNPHAARSVISYLMNQAENGVCCPIGMTYATMPALRATESVRAEWEPLVLSTKYDSRYIPGQMKAGVTVGMAMTEKQGGSDLRKTQTTARAHGPEGAGEAYELIGHKWFTSAPMCDLFFTLAQTSDGVSCFLMPRFLPDGTRNPILIQRLKDKCGNRSNASTEIELQGTYAVLVGEPGHGIRTILEMGHLCRLDFAVGSAGLMRQALSQAVHHCETRDAFNRRLVDLPMMTNVLADLALEVEADTLMALRLCVATDNNADSETEKALARIGTPVAKYWNCKRAPSMIVEALECTGGNGFIEESPMPRLYREAPLNSIWEGTANMMCLDVLRAMKREPQCFDAYVAEMRAGASGDPALHRFADELQKLVAAGQNHEFSARRIVEMMAIGIQASLMNRYAGGSAAAAFSRSRLTDSLGRTFGILPEGSDAASIVRRASLSES